MADDKTPDDNTRDDARSDIQQAVEARSDALKRGEGGKGESFDGVAGEGGADGVVKNQDHELGH